MRAIGDRPTADSGPWLRDHAGTVVPLAAVRLCADWLIRAGVLVLAVGSALEQNECSNRIQ
jgi:hypothetical protein